MTPANLRTAAVTRSALSSAAALRHAPWAAASSWPTSPTPTTSNRPTPSPLQSHPTHQTCSITPPCALLRRPAAQRPCPSALRLLPACMALHARRSFHIPAYSPGKSDATPEPPTQQPPQQQQQQEQLQEQESTKYSPLHADIERFARDIYPSEEERRSKEDLIEEFRKIIDITFGGVARNLRTQVFGSYASGLCTWQSDVDLVITGFMQPNSLAKGVYEGNTKSIVASNLRKLYAQLLRSKHLGISAIEIIPRARMPIIKVTTRRMVQLDICISDASGVQASHYMLQQTLLFPQLKPLVFVLKSYLRARGLNDVAAGGLGSYSLCNMVLAHLQEEAKYEHDTSDLGELLYSFLLRYGDGEGFDYDKQAVSVRSGGIVPKSSLSFPFDQGKPKREKRLCVDCPLSGRDVSGGSFNIEAVQDAFVDAARELEKLARRNHRRGSSRDVTKVNYLSALFNVPMALGQGPNHWEREMKLRGRKKSKAAVAAAAPKETLGEPSGPGLSLPGAAVQAEEQGQPHSSDEGDEEFEVKVTEREEGEREEGEREEAPARRRRR